MAVRNLQNLGSIWSNDDLTLGEKLLQTITNLGMAVGMIIPAYQKLNTIYKAHQAAKMAEITATNTDTGAKIANAGATELNEKVTKKAIITNTEDGAAELADAAGTTVDTGAKIANAGATVGATAANEAFKASLLSNPFTAIAMAIMAIVVALGSLINRANKAREELIEFSKEQINLENQKQEEIKKNEELYNSIG
jgi:hypothetical protein